MTNTVEHNVYYWQEKEQKKITDNLICEEPLSIRIQGNAYSVVMRTPGEEIAHVAGFCLGEGIVDSPDDILSIAFCDGEDTNVVAVTLKESRRNKIPDILDRRQYISQTSCGLCGNELIKELYQQIRPVNNEFQADFKLALKSINELSDHQELRKKTRTTHAAAIYNGDFKLLAISEDVGRHNALDKVIGRLFLDNKLNEAKALILSSRISYELVQKAARARLPVIIAVSKPTSLAVELASELNIALASLSNSSGLYIYCHQNRFK